MTTINLSEMDYLGCKLSNRASARFYVRSGKAFLYLDNQRFNIDHVPAVVGTDFEFGTLDPSKQLKDLDLKKELTLHGTVNFWEGGLFYAYFFVDDKRKHQPIALRFCEREASQA